MSDPGPRSDRGTFDSASFDLDAYLERIGHTGARAATLQTLQEIAARHPQSIPFENLDALLRVSIGLDTASLQRKLLARRRGGWCYEHNLLLGNALTALGFHVTGLAARVAWQVPADMIRPRTHMLLRVDLEEPAGADGAARQAYLVDVGFGGLTLTGVLRMQPDVEQPTPHEKFRIRHGGSARNPPNTSEVFVMEASVRGEWQALYTFDLQPQALVDYEATNWYLANHPQSHFLSTLVAARVDGPRRYALRNHELSIHHVNGETERRTLASAAEIRRALGELFHVDVPDGADVDEALERLIAAAL
jgi:N-hydroxyarylamine O-acetyltransferase